MAAVDEMEDLKNWEGGSGDDGLDGEEQRDDDDQPGGADYATLHHQGPQTSAGSTGHPENCMPCTFYCFTRRGCNRGAECRFCHLTHQSKLQQRREAWKQQQREKRKSIRERVAAEASARRQVPEKKPQSAVEAGSPNLSVTTNPAMQPMPPMPGSKNTAASGRAKAPGQVYKDTRRPDAGVSAGGHPDMNMIGTSFVYAPNQVILTLGQQAQFIPQLTVPARGFRVANGSQLPQVLVDAELPDGQVVRASLEVEVIDFTRGGFVIGHMSEFRPGKYMLLLHVPEDGAEGGNQWKDAGRSWTDPHRCALEASGWDPQNHDAQDMGGKGVPDQQAVLLGW